MKNDRGIDFNVGDKVCYQYPVDGCNSGIVKRIDGFDVYIEFTPAKEAYVIHRYYNEILECLSKN